MSNLEKVYDPSTVEERLYKKWMAAKAQKDFAAADEYRAALMTKGII